MQRYGSVIEVRPDKIEQYKQLHADVWPGVAEMIRRCHIHNYSIYLRELPDGRTYLFSYFEYHGDDFAADAAKMGRRPRDAAVVGPLRAVPEAAARHRGGAVVGPDGRGLPPGLIAARHAAKQTTLPRRGRFSGPRLGAPTPRRTYASARPTPPALALHTPRTPVPAASLRSAAAWVGWVGWFAWAGCDQRRGERSAVFVQRSQHRAVGAVRGDLVDLAHAAPAAALVEPLGRLAGLAPHPPAPRGGEGPSRPGAAAPRPRPGRARPRPRPCRAGVGGPRAYDRSARAARSRSRSPHRPRRRSPRSALPPGRRPRRNEPPPPRPRRAAHGYATNGCARRRRSRSGT